MARIHWIHISDLHYNKVGIQTDAMRERLPEYIFGLAKEDKINYIFFTGDIRFAPKTTFLDEAADYFSGLCSAAGITNERLFVVIGNHDVNRKDPKRLTAIKELKKCYIENDSVIDAALINKLKVGRHDYYTLLKKILTNEQYLLHSDPGILHFSITTNDLNIVHVDSTIMYTKSKQSDFFVGSYALKTALRNCDRTKPTILLSHYSLDCFDPAEQKAILLLLKDYNVQLWLAGHKHTDIIYKDRDYFYVAHSGNQTYEKLTTPGFVEGFLDTESGEGYFRVHNWNTSSGWAVCQTLTTKTDLRDMTNNSDRTKYPFTLDDWLKANGRKAKIVDSSVDAVLEFIHNYKGQSFFLNRITTDLKLDAATILPILDNLQNQGVVRPVDFPKTIWQIL